MGNGAVVLLSGGMDSCVLLHYVLHTVAPAYLYGVSFYYGQQHNREVAMARRQMEAVHNGEHLVVDLSFYAGMLNGASSLLSEAGEVPPLAAIDQSERDQPVTYVPNRNMVFLSVAAGLAESRGCSAVYYGAQCQDEYSYWDCTEEFVNRLNAVFELNRRIPARIKAPFVNMRKSELVREGVRLGVDFSNTWSCYRGGVEACGVCPTCKEREKAFMDAGIEDPLRNKKNA
mgnify:CR=1 FL=1